MRAPSRGLSRWTGVAAGVAILIAAAPASAVGSTLVVMLFDGWSPEMVESGETPALDALRGEGAWTHTLAPAFPTVSLINHVTVSTGCWPGSHGIVTNVFWDPGRGVYDHSPDTDWLTGCEHLHQAAERQGMRSAALWWVGDHSSSRGPQASVVEERVPWDQQPGDMQKAERVVELLRLPAAERPGLILVYLQGPDTSAHFEGIDAEATRAVVAESDAAVARVQAELQRLRDEGQRVALAVTTDHGMVPVETLVNLKRILQKREIPARFHSSGTTSFLYFDDPTQVEAAYQQLSGYAEFDVFRRGDLPESWHLGHSPRVGDLVISAHPPYFIEDLHTWPWWAQWLGDWGPEFVWAAPALAATHGYPPETPGMDAIFYLWGDGVAATRLEGMRSVDIHPTLAAWLAIEPGAPVDGRVVGAALAPAPSAP